MSGTITETSNFDTTIVELEITDAVQGGAGGVANKQAQSLANRTRWLLNQINSILASLTGYAPIASPALTGSPQATTANAGDSSTRIATTAFVQGAAATAVKAAGCAPQTSSLSTGNLTPNVTDTVYAIINAPESGWVFAFGAHNLSGQAQATTNPTVGIAGTLKINGSTVSTDTTVLSQWHQGAAFFSAGGSVQVSYTILNNTISQNVAATIRVGAFFVPSAS